MSKSSSSFFSSQPIKLLIAIGGIYTSYIYYGLIMEKLFNHDYSGLGRKKGTFDSFKFGFATSLFQNLFSFVLAAIINRVFYNQSQSVMSTKTQVKMSVVNFVSIYLASTSLAYVSFPIQAIMKSSKILSILIVSLFFRSKTSHTKTQYLCGVLITAGIVLFNFLQDTKGKHGGGETSLIGLGMIIASLFCDGLLGVVQEEAKKESRPSAWDLMESINKWGFLFCLFVALASGQIMQFIEYVKTYPACLTDLILLSVLGTVGQIFIFYTISNFSPLLLSIITTTRKFFTVLVSIIIYDHAMNFYQWVAIALVFVGVFIEMLGGKKHGSANDQKAKETPEPVKSQASVKTSQNQSQSKVTKRG